jgi:hypothetical protein
MRLLYLLHAAGLFLAFPLHAGVLINEIMYHPVERPAFDAAGDPVLDLTEDVHEFIELKNTGSTAVSLAGWRLRGAADYDFPAGASIPAQGFAVVAKFPARLESIAAYALPAGSVFGPWSGGLKNSGDTIRLETVSGAVADAVSYSSSMPWAIGANAFGAEDDWTSINETLHQYRGRSLERVSIERPGELAGLPACGRAFSGPGKCGGACCAPAGGHCGACRAGLHRIDHDPGDATRAGGGAVFFSRSGREQGAGGVFP